MPIVKCRALPVPKEASKCGTLGAVRRALLLCMGLFVALEAVAMTLYPGGTWWEPGARGYRFWENYVCDTTLRVALNGQSNSVGAVVSQAAMLVLVAGFVPFWWLAGGSGGRVVRGLGAASVLGTAAVTLMPSDRFGAMHGMAVMVAATTGLAAAVLATVAQLRAGDRIAGWLGVGALGSAGIDFGMYVHTFASGGAGWMAVPAVQKLALGLLLGWMGVVARGRGAGTSSPTS
jgi:hypothetical protein